MGDKPRLNHDLQKVMRRIEKGHFKLARRALNNEWALAVDTSVGYKQMNETALYYLTSALIWLLQKDDRAWEEDRKAARVGYGWSKDLEVSMLHEYATLLIRHGWRSDKVEGLLQEVLDHTPSKSTAVEIQVRQARILTDWGEFLYGQKRYSDAQKRLSQAMDKWTAIQKLPARILTAEQKSWMTEANWLLLRVLFADKADRATINRVAKWTIRYDRSAARKTAAATTLRRISKTSDA